MVNLIYKWMPCQLYKAQKPGPTSATRIDLEEGSETEQKQKNWKKNQNEARKKLVRNLNLGWIFRILPRG